MPTPAPNAPPLSRGGSPTALTLIDRCLAHDPAAWDKLYEELQPKLLYIVRNLVGVQAGDDNLVEEIVARIWFTLIDRGYRSLRRFDQDRGLRISTYLVVLARYEWLKYCRSERRRIRREHQFATTARKESDGRQPTLFHRYEEFRARLTPRERFYWAYLVGDQSDHPEPQISQSNAWKLRERIRKKLQQFAAESSPE